MNSDSISNLPVDKTEPTSDELRIVNTLFKEHKSTMDVIYTEVHDAFIVGVLFVIVSLPQVEEQIHKFFPATVNSIYWNMTAKAVLMMVLYWTIKNFYLSRKRK